MSQLTVLEYLKGWIEDEAELRYGDQPVAATPLWEPWHRIIEAIAELNNVCDKCGVKERLAGLTWCKSCVEKYLIKPEVLDACICGHGWETHGKYGTARCDACDCGSFLRVREAA